MKGDGQKSPHRVFHSPACEFLDYYTTCVSRMQVFFYIFFDVAFGCISSEGGSKKRCQREADIRRRSRNGRLTEFGIGSF